MFFCDSLRLLTSQPHPTLEWLLSQGTHLMVYKIGSHPLWNAICCLPWYQLYTLVRWGCYSLRHRPTSQLFLLGIKPQPPHRTSTNFTPWSSEAVIYWDTTQHLYLPSNRTWIISNSLNWRTNVHLILNYKSVKWLLQAASSFHRPEVIAWFWQEIFGGKIEVVNCFG